MAVLTRLLILLVLIPPPIAATEGGGSNYLPGFYGDLGMGVFPDQSGTYFLNFFAAYQDTAANTGVLLEMPGILQVTDQHFLGGQFVFGAFPAIMAAKDNTAGNNLDRVALGDFYFVPGGLSWKWKNLNAFLFEGVVAPTGYYRAGDFNIGRNYWTLDHNLLLTWNLPANFEISLGLGYMNNLQNQDTGYRSGDEFHMDYTVGYYPINNFGFGVAGSYYKQVTRDEAPQELVVTEAGEGSTIGPVVMYTEHVGDRDVTVSLKWLREFNVTGRAEQEYLICRLFMPI